MTNRDEEPLGDDLAGLAAQDVSNSHARHAPFVAEHLLDDGVRHELDLRVRPGAVVHDRRGPELFAPVHDHHLLRELRQEDRLFHRRVAAADDDDFLLLEEGGVADGAVGDAAALQRLLGVEPELASARAGRDDHCPCLERVVTHLDGERPLREVDCGHVVGQELGAETLRLRAEVLHHRGAQHAFGIPGVVLDVARDHELAAEGDSFDHERIQV